ncbi:uncharacterized protein LOC134270271 [Saccostrea cucullata]|uniref:uncharacterized protein LOC134270271 n=1 Tax=Saccostrea cuccullata TaxID=36930 RepID=UPI002ED01947
MAPADDSQMDENEHSDVGTVDESDIDQAPADDSQMNVTNLEDVYQPYKNPDTNSLSGKFLSMEQQIEILQNQGTTTNHTEIPKGVKENVFFVLNDAYNARRRAEGKSSSYPDDCGAWMQGKNITKPEYFLKTQLGFQNVRREKSGMYFRRLKGNKVPLSPQPTDEQILLVKRKYSTLAREQKYRKRVTWFDNHPFLEAAFVEYLGPYPEDSPSIHGNSKNNVPYQRLTLQQQELIQSSLEKNQPPREIKNEVRKNIPDDPITLKTARNAKYSYEKKKHPQNKQNLADEVITVLNKKYEDASFVKEVLTSANNKPPNVILYSEEQMTSMRSSIKNGCIIGIDRTFNVGSCYLTVTTFKNTNLVRNETSEPPIMLGPIYLHWDGTYHTYQRFLSHLQGQLHDVDQSKIIFGTDGEKALTNAIESCFPASTHTLCTRHLKENLRHHLKNHLTNPDVQEIIDSIFNRSTGLLTVESDLVYKEMENEIKEKHDLPYLNSFLCKVSKEVFESRKKTNFTIPKLWTNNNNESYNNVIKLQTDWRILKLPALIDVLQDLDSNQTSNIRDSLHSRGDLRVRGPADILLVSNEVWVNLTPEQRQRRLQRLLNFIIPASSVTSKDGSLTIPKVATIAKKPGQRKRAKACKSTTLTKKTKTS